MEFLSRGRPPGSQDAETVEGENKHTWGNINVKYLLVRSSLSHSNTTEALSCERSLYAVDEYTSLLR